jgi:hypothetical protein
LACGAGAYLAAVMLSPVLKPTRVTLTAQWGELETKAEIGRGR